MTNYHVMVGDERVKIRVRPGSGKTYVHVHQNEVTALQACKAVVRKQGGTLISLSHRGGRNIVFHLNGVRYECDPNRIFTPVGIKKTLAENSQYTPEAALAVEKLATQIKALLPTTKVVAAHNNDCYSLKNYFAGHDLAKEAQALHYDPKQYFRNFFIVTKRHDFIRLKNLGFNGILQDKNATDDGSLSVYLAKHEYINIEAGYGELASQIQMLSVA